MRGVVTIWKQREQFHRMLVGTLPGGRKGGVSLRV